MRSIKFFVISLLIIGFFESSSAQIFKGEVNDLQKQLLPNANVQWLGSQIGTVTDDKGAFAIPFPKDTLTLPFRLVISYSGARDTFSFDDLHDEFCIILILEVNFLGQLVVSAHSCKKFDVLADAEVI